MYKSRKGMNFLNIQKIRENFIKQYSTRRGYLNLRGDSNFGNISVWIIRAWIVDNNNASFLWFATVDDGISPGSNDVALKILGPKIIF